MSAIIYTRFSPRPDAATSESCDIQRAYCEEYAFKKGLKVRASVDDPDRSGSDEYREKLWEAIDQIRTGDVLLVYKRDRLARNVYLAEMINRAVAKRGGTILAVAGDVEGNGPEQVLIRQIVAAMAEYERKLISKRTSYALRRMQAMGKRVSARPPFGWMVDPNDECKLVRCDAEQETLAEIMRRSKAGESNNHIAMTLDPAKSRTGRWHAGSVRNIILRNSR